MTHTAPATTWELVSRHIATHAAAPLWEIADSPRRADCVMVWTREILKSAELAEFCQGKPQNLVASICVGMSRLVSDVLDSEARNSRPE